MTFVYIGTMMKNIHSFSAVTVSDIGGFGAC